MTRAILIAVFLTGCAEGTPATRQSGGSCSIAEPTWPGVPRDFDRGATLDAIARLAEAARADRERLKAGAVSEVGSSFEAMRQGVSPNVFISAGVAELAIRLRQLDCAVRASRLESARADASYAQILSELEAERHTLGS